MAKKSAIDKNLKLKKRIENFLNKRRTVSVVLKNSKDNPLEGFLAMKFLDKTARSSFVKYRNRCSITGRPRGYRGAFGICRNMLRYYASFGVLVGVKKMS